MPVRSSPPYRFGDVLALARRGWILRLRAELTAQGFPGYRMTDSAVMRPLLGGPVTVGGIGRQLGVTRQAARKIARTLEQRGLVTTEPHPTDARKLNVVLTTSGTRYASAVVAAIATLNRDVASRFGPEHLGVVDAVLRAVVDDEGLLCQLERIPAP